MQKFSPFPFLMSFLLITGCTFKEEISDQALHDRVIACAAGFSEGIKADLDAAYDKTRIGGDMDFEQTSQAIIFENLPPSDRLKAYEYYIQCLDLKKPSSGNPKASHARKKSHAASSS